MSPKFFVKLGKKRTVLMEGMLPAVVPVRLNELKHKGLVHKMKWSDGERVWMLTPRGYKRHDYYKQRDKKREESGEEAGPAR